MRSSRCVSACIGVGMKRDLHRSKPSVDRESHPEHSEPVLHEDESDGIVS